MAYDARPPPPSTTAPRVSQARRFMLSGLYAWDVRRLTTCSPPRRRPEGHRSQKKVTENAPVTRVLQTIQRSPGGKRHGGSVDSDASHLLVLASWGSRRAVTLLCDLALLTVKT